MNETAGDAKHDYSGAAFEARLDLQGLPRRGGPWTLVFGLARLKVPGLRSVRRARPARQRRVPGPCDRGRRDDPAGWTETNGLVLRSVSAPGPAPSSPVVATSVEADPAAATLVVRGEASGAPPSFELRGPRQSVVADVTWQGDAFTATVPLRTPDWYGDPRPLVSGIYRLLAVDGDSTTRSRSR